MYILPVKHAFSWKHDFLFENYLESNFWQAVDNIQLQS